MDLNVKFEAKRRELETVEKREAFLRGQLDQAIQRRIELVGQLTLLQELATEITAENEAQEAPEADNDRDAE